MINVVSYNAILGFIAAVHFLDFLTSKEWIALWQSIDVPVVERLESHGEK